MLRLQDLRKEISNEEGLAKLRYLYCCDIETARQHAHRYLQVLDGLESVFGEHDTAAFFSAPGRTEIGGNHTDHQHGCVLAGSVNIDMIAAAAPSALPEIRLYSEGYDTISVSISDLDKRKEEENTSLSILRGTCRAYADRGAQLQGVDIYVASNVPKGSGISSSAAFEVLLGTILNTLYLKEPVSMIEVAKIGQWVENVYFGKPSGLMDQMASAVGGVVAIDFQDPAAPVVKPVVFDLAEAGLSLCIVDSGADHADLTDEYAAVPAECRSVAACCGAEVLRDVPREVFLQKLSECREACGDRAVLRALHFFNDDLRAQQETEAILKKDYAGFLQLINDSGNSSWEYLQNIIPAGAKQHQAVAVALALARELLRGEGAVRVHGGGFAGTIQCFVPAAKTEAFRRNMEAMLGAGCCHIMAIRPVGGIQVL